MFSVPTTDATKAAENVPDLQDEAHSAAPASNQLAAQLRGFGPLGIATILAIVLTGNVFIGRVFALPLGAMLVLVWVRLSRTSWRDIGYVRPKSWIAIAAIGVAAGVAFKLVMKAIVMPLLGADPINHAYHFLAGNRAAIPAALWTLIVVAGFGEETVFRGFMFERLGKLFGRSSGAKAAIVLVTSVLFGLAHYVDQGLAGAEQAMIVGLVYGSVFAVTRRIFGLMCAHAAFDLTALAIIYWDLEPKVAHLVFK